MFSKGAPESVLSRCTSILCNDDGSTAPLTASIRAELESKFSRLRTIYLQYDCIYTFWVFVKMKKKKKKKKKK